MTDDGHGVVEIFGHGVEGAERIFTDDGGVEAILASDQELVNGRLDVGGLDFIEGDAEGDFQ
jgi:hypothetical protein